MKKLFIATLILFSQSLWAAELSKDDKKVIDELLEVTGAVKIGEMMGMAIANEFVNAMAQQDQRLSPQVVSIIQEEIGKVMNEEFVQNGFINNLSYDLYPKYFTMAEIKEMVKFYQTPTGRKVAAVMPQLTQESMLAGQMHAQSIIPLLQERLMKRLAAEGIE